jgi:hypothetical protein
MTRKLDIGPQEGASTLIVQFADQQDTISKRFAVDRE